MIKICNRCGIAYPKTNEFFAKNGGSLRPECKECTAEYARAFRLARSTPKVKLTEEERRINRAATGKKWREKNKSRMKAINQGCDKRRRAKDSYPLTKGMRRAINYLLRGTIKSSSYMDYVEYDTEQLRRHIEIQFKEGMTWDNYGEWHVDHIIPVSSFTYKAPGDEEFKRCWALQNLQPLWAIENARKYY